MYKVGLICLFLALIGCLSQDFITRRFKVGIEYENSLPMSGRSDRYRHKNNYDPFFVSVTATAKKNYVISYIEVKASVDATGDVEFNLISGQTGSRQIVFQLVSNQSDFLSYSYLVYGIKEDEYKKVQESLNVS
ncbi:uncharacterized protein LOC123660723 [Melitaea cinxia]|uniref:uncharacterized protein LOC123660723 n=1 Tax=Melitaea cinxia TaxID=113334 RepID=UPI001E271E8A|nr:uncharacterized protein LOC123660723 [Melitaea cinxia]